MKWTRQGSAARHDHGARGATEENLTAAPWFCAGLYEGARARAFDDVSVVALVRAAEAPICVGHSICEKEEGLEAGPGLTGLQAAIGFGENFGPCHWEVGAGPRKYLRISVILSAIGIDLTEGCRRNTTPMEIPTIQ
jgi:hypothetical protein